MTIPAPTAFDRSARLTTDEPTGLGWALWATAMSLPWLLPTHLPPWSMFYSEVLMAALMVPIALWAVWVSKGPLQCDWLTGGFAIVALIPALQAMGGMFTFPTEARVICLYIGGTALTLLVARRAQEVAPLRLVDGLFTGLAIASVLSTGLALYQWFQLNNLGLMVAKPVDGRAIANLMQPNNLSTLFVWGLIAIWWGYSRKRFGGIGAVFGAAFLLLGVALTQSRTGWLAVALLGAAAILGRRVLRTSEYPAVWVALGVWFACLVMGLEPLRHALYLDHGLSLGYQLTAGKRPMIWHLALDAIREHPWIGYGWNQTMQAHVQFADRYPSLHTTVQHAHNVVLDLALWSGIPLTIVMLAGLGLWLRHSLRGEQTAEQRLLQLGLAVLALHAMLELPHVYAFFLLPAAIMMGTLNALGPAPVLVKIPRMAVGLVALLIGGTLVVMFNEYGRFGAYVMAARYRAAHIANVAPQPKLDLYVLRSLQDAYQALQTEPRRGMTPAELETFRRTVTRYPASASLFRYAQASALNGRPEEARRALRVLCALNPVQICEDAAAGWAEVAADGNPEMANISPPSTKHRVHAPGEPAAPRPGK